MKEESDWVLELVLFRIEFRVLERRRNERRTQCGSGMVGDSPETETSTSRIWFDGELMDD